MTETFTFDLIKDGTVCGQITWICRAEAMGEVEIEVRDGPIAGQVFVAGDFFAALAALRTALDAEGLKPACLGACLYVYPSGMSRDMGHGGSAYFLEKPRRATSEDLVDIFDPLPGTVSYDDLASVEAQEAFRMSLFETK